jgi:hypothetical protein
MTVRERLSKPKRRPRLHIRRLLRLATAGAGVTLLFATHARAEQSDPKPDRDVETPTTPAPPLRTAPREATRESETRWYGWQTLIADGGALGFAVAAGSVNQRANSPSTGLAYASLGIYLLGGPVIHLGHQSPGRAAASLGMRAGMPVLFGLIGAGAEHCSGGDWCGLSGAAIGGSLGIIAAISLDAALLAREPVESHPTALSNLRISVGSDRIFASGTF